MHCGENTSTHMQSNFKACNTSILTSHFAIHQVTGTCSSYNWKFVPSHQHSRFLPPLSSCQPPCCLFLFFRFLCYSISHICENMSICLSLCDLFSIMPSTSIHVVVHARISFLFMIEQSIIYVYMYMCITFFYPFIHGHSYFHVLALEYIEYCEYVVNMEYSSLFKIFYFLWRCHYYSSGRSVLNFWGTFILFSIVVVPLCTLTNRALQFSTSSPAFALCFW